MKDRIHPNLRAVIDNMTEEQKETISKKLTESSEVSYEQVQQRLKDAFASSHPEATISGWVARNQPISFADKGNLTLFAEKPMRDYYDYNDLTYGFWSDNEKPTIPLSVDLFPSLTWQDNPIEVEITIKPKKKC